MLLFQEYLGERDRSYFNFPLFRKLERKKVFKAWTLKSTLYLAISLVYHPHSVACIITASVPQKHRFLSYYPCSPAKKMKEKKRGQKQRKEEEEGPIFSNCNTGNKRRGGEERRRRHYE